MFTAVRRDPFLYKDPWTLTLEERIVALSARERSIAYFYGRPDTGTFRYRVFNMIEALDVAPDLRISASWFESADLPFLDRFLDRANALVVCRASYDERINRMILRARARGLPVFFDIDDLIFDTDYAHLILDTLDPESEGEAVWNHWFAYIGRIGGTLRLCDGAIVTNEFLGDKVRAFAPWMQPRIVPNFLNRVQQRKSSQIFAAKKGSTFDRDDKIYIGYFSGTLTHNRDFEIAAGALAELLDEDLRLVVRLVGFLEPQGAMLRHRDRIEIHPLQDFLNLQRLVGETEINIAPLQINAFTNCKSELKYFEAAIVGTLTIASPIFAFRKTIRQGQNGFLADAQDWGTKLRTAVSIVEDANQYAALCENAYLQTQEAYGWDRQADCIAAAVFGGPPVAQNSRGTRASATPLTQ